MLRALTLDLPPETEPAAVTAALADAVARAKVVHFRCSPFGPGTLAAWTRIAGGLGQLMANGEDGASGTPNGSIWVDVRFDPELQHTFRHSRTPQPPHTDDAYKAPHESAEYVLFLVERSARAGGETFFMDAAELADYVRVQDAALYDQLVTLPVVFAKGGLEGKTTPVLSNPERGWEITWNYYNLAPGQSAEVMALKERFQSLLCAQETMARLAYGYRLAPDEGVLLHDRKVLHGRTAFEADVVGERTLWKCSVA